MNTLIKRIKDGNFAWEKYLFGKTWNGIFLRTCPIFCSYGQIGYKVSVFDNARHAIDIFHDWEMNETKWEYINR